MPYIRSTQLFVMALSTHDRAHPSVSVCMYVIIIIIIGTLGQRRPAPISSPLMSTSDYKVTHSWRIEVVEPSPIWRR